MFIVSKLLCLRPKKYICYENANNCILTGMRTWFSAKKSGKKSLMKCDFLVKYAVPKAVSACQRRFSVRKCFILGQGSIFPTKNTAFAFPLVCDYDFLAEKSQNHGFAKMWFLLKNDVPRAFSACKPGF